MLRIAGPEVREQTIERGAGAAIMDQIICKFGELIENDILSVARELSALVVDFLDIAFRPWRADDVGGIGDPLRQPFEPFAAHPGRQHGNAAAAENPRYGNAAAAVIACRWPNRAVAPGVELADDQPRRETGIGGQHLVRTDHGKAPAEQHHDGRFYAGEGFRQHHMARNVRATSAVRTVEPVHAP